MYLSAVADRDALTMALYLGYPTVSACLGGILLGPKVFGASTAFRAAFGGVGIVALSFLIFACLYVVTLDRLGHVLNRPAFFGAVLAFGLVMTAPVLIPLGAMAGYLLHFIRRRVLGPRTSSTSH